MATFAEIITVLREEKGKKRQEVADALGISRASLEYYEKGKRKPDIEVLARFADYYGVSADYLIGRTSSKSTDRDIRFVCEFTGLDDFSIQKLHRNIGKSYNICHIIIDFFLSDKAEMSFISLCERFEDYKQCVQEFNGMKEIIDELSVTGFTEKLAEVSNKMDLAEFKVQKISRQLLEIFSGKRDELFTEEEIAITKNMVYSLINSKN